MDYKFETPEENLAVISFTVDPEAWKQDMEQAKEAAKSDDENVIREYAIASAASRVFTEAAQAHNLKLATQPSINAVDNEDGSVSITLNCPLVPQVKLGQYTGFNLKKNPIDVADEEVLQEALARVNQSRIWTKLPDDAEAENGDQVIIDFAGEKDGVPFQGGSAENYPLVLGSGSFIPGFEEQLVGMKAGDSKDIDVTFPENYPVPDLAGQPVVFKVTVHAVEKEEKPELNDAFIEKMKLNGVKTVEQLIEKARADMIGVKEQEAENRLAADILSRVASGAEVNIPEAMIKNQVQQHIDQYAQQLQQYGMTFDQFLASSKQTQAEFEERLVPQVEQEIKTALVLDAIAEKEQIQASDQELEDEYKLLETIYQFPAVQLKMLIPEDSVKYQITQRKTMDYLKEHNQD